jgi:hypothetical protein
MERCSLIRAGVRDESSGAGSAGVPPALGGGSEGKDAGETPALPGSKARERPVRQVTHRGTPQGGVVKSDLDGGDIQVVRGPLCKSQQDPAQLRGTLATLQEYV